jgi:sigma54-dependent transcription regulator
MATLAERGRITQDLVLEEISRFRPTGKLT